MIGLQIKDRMHWDDRISTELGAQFEIIDSTDDLLVFKEGYSHKTIRDLVDHLPPTAYEIMELNTVPEAECEFKCDSGICYHKK